MDYMCMMTSSSSLNCLICQQSQRELPVKPISLKNNSTGAVCTHSHRHLYHLLQVLFLDQTQHSDLLCLLHHHLQQEQPSHIRHNRARNPPQAVHYHVDREHPLLHQTHSHQHNQMVVPPARVYLPRLPVHLTRHPLHQKHNLPKFGPVPVPKLTKKTQTLC